jgi:hypothetical protein
VAPLITVPYTLYLHLEAVLPVHLFRNPSSFTLLPQLTHPPTIFDAASTEYHRVTGNHLDTHPFATQLDACEGPNAISDLFRKHTQAFIQFRKGDDKLMTLLDPIISILFTFSATLGEGIGLVSASSSFTMTPLRHLVCSHSHLQRQSLPESPFFLA